MNLEKTGKYQFSTFDEVQKFVYDEGVDEGPDYLWGLYFSEIFWKIHQKMFKFFHEDFVNKSSSYGTVLEVPVGTGFFLVEFLLKKNNWNAIGIDIADAAIKFSNSLLNINGIEKKRFGVYSKDFFKFETSKKFDRIICGEFLEHVDNPSLILQKLHGLLSENGKIFLTAAVWSGGIDHIYLYSNPDEVRKQILKTGLKIEKELVQSVFDKDENNPENGRIPVNYSAILSKN